MVFYRGAEKPPRSYVALQKRGSKIAILGTILSQGHFQQRLTTPLRYICDIKRGKLPLLDAFMRHRDSLAICSYDKVCGILNLVAQDFCAGQSWVTIEGLLISSTQIRLLKSYGRN